MTNPQGVNELYWGKGHEDVNNWVERLTMATKVRDLNDDKLFKRAKLNLCDRAKEWFKKFNPPPANWTLLRSVIVQKLGDVNTNEIRVKLDAIKQEPRE
jgi:hypothetical protein